MKTKNIENILTKDFYKKHYLEDNKTYAQISKEMNLSLDIVCYWAKKNKIKSRPSGRKFFNIFHKKFNSLLVVGKTKIKNSSKTLWICKCDCGRIVKATTCELQRSKKKNCWECRNKIISKKKWKGYGEISGETWGKIKNSAIVREYKLDISIEDAWNLFLKQNRRCALTGILLKFYRCHKDRAKTTASLDRIDSNKDYTIDNIQWVHKIVNNLKYNLKQEEFIEWCRKVSKYVTSKSI